MIATIDTSLFLLNLSHKSSRWDHWHVCLWRWWMYEGYPSRKRTLPLLSVWNGPHDAS